MNDVLHIKAHREQSGKTQADIAAIISEMTGQSITQGQISRWEDNPDSIPARLLLPIAQAIGRSVDELYAPPLGRDAMRVDPGDPYAIVRRNVGILRACLEAAPQGTTTPGVPEPAKVEELCARVERKPTVVLVGHFDAGKSRLCNALLGDDLLPARYQPTTAAGTWMVHVDDRPAWADQAIYVYAKGFDPGKMRDREHCEALRVASGGIEILGVYAAHPQGRRAEQEVTVVSYLDAPILRACNLLDTPGIQHSTADTRAASLAFTHADVLVYVSRVQGFLDQEDVVYLREQLRQLPLLEGLPPLENLLIVASHAHPGMKQHEIDLACDEGAETVLRELGETVFAERTVGTKVPISLAEVRRRVFPFWFETAERRTALRDAVRATLGVALPPVWLRGIDDEVEQFRQRAKGACDASVNQYRAVLDDIEAAAQDLARRRAVETARRSERRARGEMVLHAIHAQWQGAKLHLADVYPKLTSEAAVRAFIERRYKSRKEAEKHAVGAVIDRVQNALIKDANGRAQQLTPLIVSFLGAYGGESVELARPDGSAGVKVEFDSRGAFLGGMAGLGTVGALGAWAATLGNLGGYIIVAKVASLLASIGISVGGSAALVSLVAALGGPVVVTVTLGAALALGIGWLFGESWSSRLARKVVKTLEANGVRAEFDRFLDQYWSDTQRAFQAAAGVVEDEYTRHVGELERVTKASASSPNELKQLIASLERIRDFFGGLPWKGSGTR